MPEILEVEAARQVIEDRALRRPIAEVVADDAWYLKRGLIASALRVALVGRSLVHARRRGKLMLVDTSDVLAGRARSTSRRRAGDVAASLAASGPVLGLHLGMSGRVVVDGVAAGDPLVYASNREVE